MSYRTYTCPIARECGGCEWLAVPYPIQLQRKRRYVEELFGRMVTEDGAQMGDVIGMDRPAGYRHKAATPFAPAPHGRIRAGFYARGTHHIVTCHDCLVEDPRCRRVLNGVARTAERLRIPAYDEDRGSGMLRHAVVRAGWHTDELLLTVVANTDRLPHEKDFVKRTLEYTPEVTAIALNANTRRTNAILGSTSRPLYGGGIIHDELLGCRFRLGPASFYQTNPAQTERLYTLALRGSGVGGGAGAAESGAPLHLLDAYCGLGTIGICAAAAARDAGQRLQVLGVEKGHEAIRMARQNAADNGLADACAFVAEDATAYLTHMAREHAHFDVVIMDPPRAGSTPEFLAAVSSLAPARVVYVSCNPQTQARDLETLREGGYRLERLDAVDMFPHTKHVETVAVLERR